MIHARQLKAARALLGWSQDHLAIAARVSPTTIRNLESGDMSPRNSTTETIKRAIEDAGLEFIEPEGVRMRPEDIKVFHGAYSCDQLLDDMQQTSREGCREIVSVFTSQGALSKFCDVRTEYLERLEKISESTSIKIIVPDLLTPPTILANLQFRMAHKQNIGPVTFFAYGKKHALVMSCGESGFKFLVINMFGFSEVYRRHFYEIWENATPLIPPPSKKEHRRLRI